MNATLDRDTVSVGDAATLTLTCEGGAPKNPPTPPAVPGLRVQFGGQSSQFSWVNGESKSSITYTYALAPAQPGDYNVPPFEVKIGGETFRTPPLVIKAVRNDAAQPDAANADQQLVLVKLVAPTRPVYVGEVVPVELHVFVREGIGVQNFQSSAFSAEGFTFSGKQVQGQRHNIRIGNANFQEIPIITTATPVKTGSLNINPIDCTMVLELPSAQRQRDAFDPFGLFNRNEQRRITLSTEVASLEVLPMPEGAPADFNGAVGNFSLTITAAPTNVTAGDPVTVKIQIAGRGAIDNITLPTQTSWSDFKVYPPTSKVETTDQLGLQGAKNFELVVVPQNPEIRELPAISFSYFDPEKKTYRTLTQNPIKLAIRPGNASSNTLLAAAPPKEDAPAQDIVPIKQHLGTFEKRGPALIQRPGFWMVQTIPAIAWISLLIRRRRLENLANNPRLRRHRAVTAIIASGLEELKRLAAEKNSDDFFATLFRLLQEQLGERLDAPASSITEAVVDDRLRPLGVAAPTLQRIEELFQACNQARYAPVKSSQELEAFIPRLESTLREIREVTA